MTKWEYCRISWITRKATPQDIEQVRAEGFGEGIIEKEDGPLMYASGILFCIGSSEGPKTITKLNDAIGQLGRDGWELVSHSQVADPTSHQSFFFKREVKD